MNVSFSVITPTCGRETLARTLDSMLSSGFSKTDESIVVSDGPQPIAKKIIEAYKDKMEITYIETPPTRCFGNTQRARGLEVAKKSHILFMDDDDEYVNSAISIMRKTAVEYPQKIPMFRMVQKHGAVVWRDRGVYMGNIGSPMFVVPRIREWLGVWAERYEGDFDFIRSTLDKWPGKDSSVVWQDEIVIHCH